jgi:hypothetical protein
MTIKYLIITFCFCAILLSGCENTDIQLRADEHRKESGGSLHHEMRSEHKVDSDYNGKHEGKNNEGNEITGQITLWLLVSANLTVFLSLVIKSADRFSHLSKQTKNTLRQINQFQKKYLMKFHYYLNPFALCIAVLHFLLSCCRKSSLPEWGLLLVILMVLLGVMIKFKLAPKSMRKIVYRLHTGLPTFSIMIVLLVAGHQIID